MRLKPILNHEERFSPDRYISFAVCFQVTIVGIKNALVQAVPSLHALNNTLNMVLFVIVAVAYINAIAKSGGRFVRLRADVFAVLAIVFTSLLFSSVFFPGNGKIIMRWMPRMLPYCFITFLFLAELKSLRWIEYYMTRFCYLTIVFSLISAFYIYRIGHITSSTWSSYSMPLSYVTLVAVMWLLYKFFRKESLMDFIFILIGLIVIIAYGSRNPLLAIAAYIVIQTIRNARNGCIKGSRRILYLLGCILIVVMAMMWRQMIAVFTKILRLFSINSRTLTLLSQSTISTSGRDVIHSALWDLLNQKPLFGLGVGGDVSLINESAHGLYLSLLTSYGYILGGIAIVAILFICTKAFLSSNGINREIVLIYICMVLPRGFTGGDMWTSDVFWWMLGLCLAAMHIIDMEQNDLEYKQNDQSIAYN